MRIRGLVRTFSQVRARLQVGVPPEEADMLRAQVRGAIRQVESLCRQHGVTPSDLPGPSRSAYRFLKNLDLDRLPVVPADIPTPTTTVLRLKNVARLEQNFGASMWERLPRLVESPREQTRLRAEMAQQAAAIEHICARNNALPSNLALPSRQVYCWLKFLSAEDHLLLHLGALRLAKRVLEDRQSRPEPSVHVQLVHMASVWRMQSSSNAAVLRVSEGFVDAGEAVWQALVQSSVGGNDRTSKQLVAQFVESEDFGEVIAGIESFAAPTVTSTRGRAHDLDTSFERVNRAYFAGKIPKPRLTWSRTLAASKFGHYQPATDTVMLVASLDDPLVSSDAVDFVMYHELLHKKHGATIVNGRRLVHTGEFRADERRFARYDEVKRQLDEVARMHQR